MKMILAVVIVVVLLVLGIAIYKAEAPTTSVPNGAETVVASLNKAVEVKGHTVTVWAVTEDSRCPSDVQCIQAGKVKIALNVSSGSGTSTKEMEPGQTYTTETMALTLDKVEPYPISTKKTADADYRFYFTAKDL